MAIRQNCDNIYNKKKSVWAVLYHNCDIADEDERHKFCPRTKDSWCIWQSNKLTGDITYKKKLSLPLAIRSLIEPIFRDLSSDSLLSKCLHGQTQNNNESINGIIWKKCPKDVYVSRKILEIAVSSAVIELNDGSCGIRNVFSTMGIKCGRYMDDATILCDRL